MATDTLASVTELRSAAFALLEETADRGSGAVVSACVDHLQVVANELGAVEALLGDSELLSA
jgi:hypothetical protein